MSSTLPPLNWLRAFEASARLLSFTDAAKEMNLTQAAVSHQVRQLEDRLGTALFERLPRSLRLTDMGKAYLPAVRDAFEALSASTDSLFGALASGTITVRAPISFATLWLAPRLPDFLGLHPGIRIELTTEVWADTSLARRQDIAIRFGDGNWPGCESELIYNEGVIPVCSPAFRESNPQSLADIANEKLIHVLWGEDLWQRYLHGDEHPQPLEKHINVDTSVAALELAASGGGCTLTLRHFAQAMIDAGKLVAAEDREIPVSQSHYFVYPDSNENPRREVQYFREWLLGQLNP